MVGWHHRLKGHEFEQTPGSSEGQGSLAYCSPRLQRVSHDLATEQQGQQHNHLRVGSFTQQAAFEISPCCVYLLFVSLYCLIVCLFRCITVYLFICLVTDYRFSYKYKFSFNLGNTYEWDYLVLW